MAYFRQILSITGERRPIGVLYYWIAEMPCIALKWAVTRATRCKDSNFILQCSPAE